MIEFRLKSATGKAQSVRKGLCRKAENYSESMKGHHGLEVLIVVDSEVVGCREKKEGKKGL